MLWEHNDPWFGWPTVTELQGGVLDSAAEEVFTRGHCHSLALALKELIPDSELMGLFDGDAVAGHVFVRLPDGSYLDAEGAASSVESFMSERGYSGWIESLDSAELEDWEERQEYRENRKDDALPFAQTLIERERIELRELA